MAWAICTNCGIAVEWFAGKGFRLKYLKCPKCGGKLKGCSYEETEGRPRVDLATPYREYVRGRWEI
ncbi:MAG: hypothetical protein RMJ15_05045 [Nitrososphaerota archaeon]|nr:hypothetical protein [Nitrososphaerota archaeon]